MTVYQIGSERPVGFAARELARYLVRMTGRKVGVERRGQYAPGEPGVWVGLGERFGKLVPPRLRHREHPFDDGVFVRAGRGHAVVSGPDARSVVFAAYRYLEELGCRWLRPGRDGERVPVVAGPLRHRVRLAETPSYRHRTVCIEGSCSKRHVTDLIDYMARRGMNSYFIQFTTGHTFFDRWYAHESARGAAAKRHTIDDSARIREAVKREALKRGMILHAVGHGWTTAPFGVSCEEWAVRKDPPTAAVRKYLAKVRGRRAYFRGLPINTNLCMSNAAARRLMAGSVVEYAETHADEEVIHVWLADGKNNNCECKDCAGHRPSDLYVKILNLIDEMLAAKGIETKIVFLAYVDLLWGPVRERIRNPERFILMFAPITRSYSRSFADAPAGRPEPVGPYRRNQLSFPSSPAANLELLGGWERAFRGDSVDFDYHLWQQGHIPDPGTMQCARVLHADLAGLADLGMQGFISCQIQRVSFPTGLYQHVIGKTLWDRRISFERLVADYMKDVFGRPGPRVRRYLERLSGAFDPPFLRGEKRDESSRLQALEGWAEVPAIVADLKPAIDRGVKSKDPVTAAAWKLMREHAWFVRAAADFYTRLHSGDPEAEAALRGMERELEKRLPRFAHVFDTWQTRRMLNRALDSKRPAPAKARKK